MGCLCMACMSFPEGVATGDDDVLIISVLHLDSGGQLVRNQAIWRHAQLVLPPTPSWGDLGLMDQTAERQGARAPQCAQVQSA